jgi:lysophospholipase L1-like esterase
MVLGIAAALSLVAASGAQAVVSQQTGICTQSTGKSFKVIYNYDSSNQIVQVTDMQQRASATSAWVTFTDVWGLVSKLEWWSSNTFDKLFIHPDFAPYASPAVTLALDSTGYADWWAAVDQRTDILARPVYAYLNPRVEFRSNGTPLDRGADSCDVYLGNYSAGSGTAPKRVAHIGDSISDQMAPELAKWNNLIGRQYFIDPQSGQSYTTMLGEARAIAGGVRTDPGGAGSHQLPNAMVIALGTNDVVRGKNYPVQADFNLWQYGMTIDVNNLLDATSAVSCRVVMTVRDQSVDVPAPTQAATFHQAAVAYNDLIKAKVNANPTGLKLADWAATSATHAVGSGAPWFTASDHTHPNAAGLAALTSLILDTEQLCLGTG